MTKTRNGGARRIAPSSGLVCESIESRLMLSAAPVERPDYNTGTGFFVAGGKVYDANGNEFIIRGVNMNHWWGNPTDNLNAIDQIAKTGANTVRAVFNWSDSTGGSDTPAKRRTIVEKYIADDIVPMVEDHATTTDALHADPTALSQVVDHWLDPANVSWLKQYEDKLILNVANEWGPSDAGWRDAYITQVQRLRDAGINAMIVLDAGGWGQDINTIKNYAQAVEDADPQHNILFSIHFYGQWRTEDRSFEVNPNAGTWDINTELGNVQNMGLPILVGEFSWEGEDSSKHLTRRILQICDDRGIGYMGWSWNGSTPSQLNMVGGSINLYQYNSNLDLAIWGDDIINDPDHGIKATSVRATVFPPAAPRFVLENTWLRVPEGGLGVARVRLSSQPSSDVLVSLAKLGGGSDADINLAPGVSALTFTPGNWDQYQTIVLSAAYDADSATGTARFQLSASGLTTTDIVARELDSNLSTGAFALTPTQDRGSTTASGTATTATASLSNAFVMRFSLASIGGLVNSGSLSVYKTSSTSNRTARLWFAYTDNWTETTGSSPVLSFPVATLVMPNAAGLVTFDITSAMAVIAKDMLRDSTGFFTLGITTNSGSSTTFATRENSTAGVSKPTLTLNSVEAVPPLVQSGSFDYSNSPNTLKFVFSEDVGGSLATSDVLLESISNPANVVALSSVGFDALTRTATFAFSNGTLPDGTYRATLLASGVTDSAGNHLIEDTSVDFFSLAGDANRDRKIDIVDLGALASHWQQPSGATFADGDFNYDGVVNIVDLGILASRWQSNLPAPTSPLGEGLRVNACRLQLSIAANQVISAVSQTLWSKLRIDESDAV